MTHETDKDPIGRGAIDRDFTEKWSRRVPRGGKIWSEGQRKRKGLPPEIWKENIPGREQQGPRRRVRMSLLCARHSERTFIHPSTHSCCPWDSPGSPASWVVP